jgi:pyruvate ferredoxin oxidoreductase gamma subunit
LAELLEMRWHARAGQGAVSAAKNVAQLMGAKGQHVQCFPEYGAEKRGAPLAAFNRVSSEPIRNHSAVYSPKVAIVLDMTLYGLVDFTKGLPQDGVVFLNTPLTPAEARQQYGIGGYTLYTIPASEIAVEEIKRDIPNAPLIGAVVAKLGLMPREQFLAKLTSLMEKSFDARVAAGNVRAATRGMDEVKSE